MALTDWLQVIIAFFTVVIAICAVYISYKSFKMSKSTLAEQQEHDQLSVRPILTFGSFSFWDHTSLYLGNNGMGPAIIKSITVYYDNNVQIKEPKEPWPPKNLLSLDVPNIAYEINDYPADSAIIVGNTADLISCNMTDRTNTDQIDEMNSVAKELNKIKKVVAEYTDIYGKKTWTASTEYFFPKYSWPYYDTPNKKP
jgi:hypothetical protein